MATTLFSCGLKMFTPHKTISPTVQFAQFTKKQASYFNLASSSSISATRPLVLSKSLAIATPIHRNSRPLTVVCAKGYKRKTHKASAKRFRVTGTGKIVRRRAGKQHLLRKKNTKRRNRLSKMV